MKIKDFYELVELNVEPDVSLLSNLQYRIKKYPYFQPDIFIYIKCLYISNSENLTTELTRLSPFVSDRKALFYYVMGDEYKQFQKKVEKHLTVDRTNILINAFFESLDVLEDQSALNDMIGSPNLASVDYFSYLDAIDSNDVGTDYLLGDFIPEEELDIDVLFQDIDTLEMEDGVDLEINTRLLDSQSGADESAEIEEELEEENDIPKLKHQDIIDKFIEKAASEESLRLPLLDEYQIEEYTEDELDNSESESTPSELENDYFFTQTLANIYIKQKKYDRAYEIIKHLSLAYPEKNIYFADQLSFLEKLLKNKNINK